MINLLGVFLFLAAGLPLDDCTRTESIVVGGVGGPTARPAIHLKDGALALLAPLAVNPDGGASSYTAGDHGFTYISDGIARFDHGQRSPCDSKCGVEFAATERADFAAGTQQFCVFAMEVEPYKKTQAPLRCVGGAVVGNGLGRIRKGALLKTATGSTVQAYASTTSLRHIVAGTERYLDSESLPILVAHDRQFLGRVAWVQGVGLHGQFALIGDEGPAFGEGSIALHQLLRTGEVVHQMPGPIPKENRCTSIETTLAPPFVSKPDERADKCAENTPARYASDIRASAGIDGTLRYLILGQAAAFAVDGNVIAEEVTTDKLRSKAQMAGYTPERIQQDLACLGPE